MAKKTASDQAAGGSKRGRQPFSYDLVSVGDTIECTVSNPRPRTMQVTISTPEACVKANVLVATGRWWKV